MKGNKHAKKRILLVNDYETYGGAESVFALQALCLKDDFEVDLFYGTDVDSKRTPFSYVYSTKAEQLFYNKLRDNNYDVIHIHNYHHLLSPSIFQSIRKIKLAGANFKVIYTAHDFHLVCPNSGFYYYNDDKIVNFDYSPKLRELLFRKIDNRSLSHDILKKIQWTFAYKIKKYQKEIDFVVSPSNFLKMVLSRNISNVIDVIRNPVEIASFDSRKPLRSNGDYQSRPLNIVFMGRLHKEKGLSEFINALDGIKDVPYTLSIYGDGPQKESIQKLIIKKQLEDKVFLKGIRKREELLNELGEYNAFVLPSIWYENAPMSIIEAAAAGLAIITTNHGGMVEIAEECGGGFYFDYNDCESLKNCLVNCRHSLIQIHLLDNIELIKKNFSISTFKSELTKLYK